MEMQGISVWPAGRPSRGGTTLRIGTLPRRPEAGSRTEGILPSMGLMAGASHLKVGSGFRGMRQRIRHSAVLSFALSLFTVASWATEDSQRGLGRDATQGERTVSLQDGAQAPEQDVRGLDLAELLVASTAEEPFYGRIALIGAEGLGRQDISVGLASKADFSNHGLERFDYLETLRFAVEPPHVQVWSIAPIPDAYLNFLVRLTWPGGASLREYAVLLGAPGSAPIQPQATLPVAEPAPTSAPSKQAGRAPPTETSPASAQAVLTRPVEPFPASAETVTVQPTDTLWRIAAATLPHRGASVQQQMLAILRENPHAFVGNNINGLVAGAILRLPEDAAATSWSSQQAMDEARRQNRDWGSKGAGQLRIINAAHDSPSPTLSKPQSPKSDGHRLQSGADATDRDSKANATDNSTAAPAPPPEPPLADLLQQARRQVREQAGQLERRDDEIARLNAELAALRIERQQERHNWTAAIERWRFAALAGLLPTAGLVAVGLARLRRGPAAYGREATEGASLPESGQGASPAKVTEDSRSQHAGEGPDHDFGAPLDDSQVKLNLARSYIDLNDPDQAREVLEEVIAEGTESEQSEARALLSRLGDGPPQPTPS